LVSCQIPNPDIFQEKDFSVFNKCFKNIFKGRENVKILVSLSGGSDSVLLLYLMLRFFESNKQNITAAHINHNLRTNSINDQKFILELGKVLKVETIIRQLNPSDKTKKESVESWAREGRYNILNELAIETQSDVIVTGHHKNDQVETILKNLSEEAGLYGLSGMKVEYKNIIRPLLSFSKNQLNKIIDKYNIPYKNDSSNDNLKFKRNFIRKQILKPWESHDNELVESIATAGSNFQEYQNALQFFINDFISIHTSKIKDGYFTISKNAFSKLPLIARILVLQNLTNTLGRLRKYDFENIKNFLVNKKIGNIYKSRFGWVLLNDRIQYFLHINQANIKKIKTRIYEQKKINYNEYDYIFKRVDKSSKFSFDPNIELFELDKIKNRRLYLRLWRSGDNFSPLGILGNQKVSDYLVNKKVNQFEKRNQAVLVAEEKIIWLCGHRIDNSVKVSNSSKHVVEIKRVAQSNPQL
jgi:tRNA(Ile)-lysidine synthase